MNILNNIAPESLLIRTFIMPEANSALEEFEKIPLRRIFGPDPQYVQFSPFESGYDITVSITTCVDLRYIADRNLLVEIVVVPTVGNPVQIGAEEGFELISIIPPASPDKDAFVYTFKTNKPNNQPYKTRSYVQ